MYLRAISSLIVPGLFALACSVLLLYWDKGRRSLVLALRSLWLHKLRAFLSVLGIIIGTGGRHRADGLRRRQHAGRPRRHSQRRGATNIIVRSVKPPENSGDAAAAPASPSTA